LGLAGLAGLNTGVVPVECSFALIEVHKFHGRKPHDLALGHPQKLVLPKPIKLLRPMLS
jgi:hypothetical protein